MTNVILTPTKRGFKVTRQACIVCGEPPFGTEYCCGHSQEPKKAKAPSLATMERWMNDGVAEVNDAAHNRHRDDAENDSGSQRVVHKPANA